MSISSLPDLPPDVSWLIHMEPTREALDAYLDPPYRLPIDAPAGAHRQPFTLSNIWAAHPTTPEYERRYSLTLDNAWMFGYTSADASAHDMLPLPPPGPLIKEDSEEGGWLYDGFHSKYAPLVYQAAHEAWQRHTYRMQHVSRTFSRTLRDMLDHYEGVPRSLGAAASQLAFDPHVSPLPSYELVDALSREQAIAHLMLLVARHELGYIVLKVQAWLASSSTRLSLSGEPFLTDDDWGLLSARARGHTSIRTGSAMDQGGHYRDDAPIDTFEPASDVSRLYVECKQWAAAVYTYTLGVRRCKLDGCDRIVPQSMGTGRPQEYCCLPHRREGTRRRVAEAKKAAAEERRNAREAARASVSRLT